MAMFGRATRNDVLRSYTPTMAERIPIAVQGFLGRLGLNKYQARSFGQPIADVLGYSPVGAVAQSWDAGQSAARAPGMFGKAAALGGGMALAALGAVPGGKALARKGEALAMDEASRMARAAEQGFDVDATLYHGTAHDINKFKPSTSGALGPGVYVGDSSVANSYASQAGWRMTGGDTVMPLIVPKGPYATEAQFDEAVLRAPVNLNGRGKHQNAADELARQGFVGVEARTYDGEGHPSRVIFDPANIRSKFAAFDPAKRGSANLLAGVGAGAIVAPSMFGNRGGER